jgi:hypothetical protein
LFLSNRCTFWTVILQVKTNLAYSIQLHVFTFMKSESAILLFQVKTWGWSIYFLIRYVM